MKVPCFLTILLLTTLTSLQLSFGLRIIIDREECFSQKVEYDWDNVFVSYVIIKYDTQWQTDAGVDLVVKGPTGDQVHDSRDKTSEKFEFVAHQKGNYQFCFTNKSPYHETIDFDIQVGHFTFYEQHAKDEHLKPLYESISKLEEVLYNIQFEQHWLEAQTDRQAVVNEGMSRRAFHKVLFESAALISASVLQVYLMRRLFEKKLGTVRVRQIHRDQMKWGVILLIPFLIREGKVVRQLEMQCNHHGLYRQTTHSSFSSSLSNAHVNMIWTMEPGPTLQPYITLAAVVLVVIAHSEFTCPFILLYAFL